MTPKNPTEVAAELLRLRALLDAHPNIPSPAYVPVTPGVLKPPTNPICTAVIKGAIQGLDPKENLLGIYLEEMDGTDDTAAHVYGECLAYQWSRDIRAWLDWGIPDPDPSLPPSQEPSEVIAAGLPK